MNIPQELITEGMQVSFGLVNNVRQNRLFSQDQLVFSGDPLTSVDQDFEYNIISQDVTQNIIMPVIDAISMLKPDIDRRKYICSAHNLLVPKCYGFAHQVVAEYELPAKDRSKVAEVAAFVYLVDAIVDNSGSNDAVGEVQDNLAKMMMIKSVEPFICPDSERYDFLGIDRMINALGIEPGSEDDFHLRRIIIANGLTIPQKFEMGMDLSNTEGAEHLDGVDDITKIVRIKIDGSGYDIAFWTAMYILKKNGLYNENPRDILSNNPELDKARRIGALITRHTDDTGDVLEDSQKMVINITSNPGRVSIYKRALEYCDIDPSLFEEGMDDAQILQILVDNFNYAINSFEERKAKEYLETGQGRTIGEFHTMQLLRKTAIITYENYIGDRAQYANAVVDPMNSAAD